MYKMVQINLSLSGTLASMAKEHADAHGFGNIQELAREAIREMVINGKMDTSVTEDEKKIIEKFVPLALRSGFGTEEDLKNALQ